MIRHRRKPVRVVGVLLVAATLVLGLGGFVAAPSATAQQEPYSSSTTTTPPSSPPLHITISIHTGPAGVRVRIVVCCLPVGTRLTVRFNGIVVVVLIAQQGVGTGEALVAGSHHPLAAVQAGHLVATVGDFLHLGRARAAANDAGVDGQFVVPDLAPGVYPVCASAPGAEPGCTDFRVMPRGSVLGETFTRGRVSANRPGSTSGLTGLVRTGIEVALLVIAAVGLLVLGRFLVLASRRSSQRRGAE